MELMTIVGKLWKNLVNYDSSLVDGTGKGEMVGFLFWSSVSSSETTTCNTPVLWAWATTNQWLWALLSLFILWGRRKRSE